MREIRFGIIGNMGPEADEVFQRILRTASNAASDQEHVAVVVVKNPDIPDRTLAIKGAGDDPVGEIVASARILEGARVQFAVMPCNTAHHFLDRVRSRTRIHILDMVGMTVSEIARSNPRAKVGILATTGTMDARLYEERLRHAGIVCMSLGEDEQEALVQTAIYGPAAPPGMESTASARLPLGIKSGRYEENARLISAAVAKLAADGADTVLLGCTELAVIRALIEDEFPALTFVDPMEVAAATVVRICRLAEAKAAAGHPAGDGEIPYLDLVGACIREVVGSD